jgi:hypothetical protein
MLKDIAGSGNLELDTTLSIAGKAADAKAVGDAIGKLSGVNQETVIKSGVMVNINADEGAEIKVEADTTEAVTLVHQGKNFYRFDPAQNGITRNGIQITINADGSATLNGTATSTVYVDWLPKANAKYIPAGIYAISSNVDELNSDSVKVYVQTIDMSGATAIPGISNKAAAKRAFVVDEGVKCFGSAAIFAGAELNNFTLWVQLERGTHNDYLHPEQFTAYEKCTRKEISTMLPATVEALDGTNIFYTIGGDILTVEAPKRTVKYVLPVGGTELGGVKNGGNVVINADGTMTAPVSGNANTETVTKTGVVASIEADKGVEITVNADTTEAVELYHSGINLFPKGIRKDSSRYPDVVQNADGSISFSGVPSEKNYYTFCTDSGDEFWLPPGQYTFTGFGFPYIETVVTAYITFVAQDGTAPFDGKSAVSLHANNYGKQIIIHDGTLVKATLAYTNEVPDDLTMGYMLCRNDIATAEFVAPTLNKVETTLPTTLSAHEGKNIFYTRNADVLTVSYTKAESGVDTDSVNKLIANALKFDPTPYGIPVLTLNGVCAGMSKENYVLLDFTFRDKEGNPIAGTAEVKKQGSSSISIGAQIGKDFDNDVGGLFNFTIKFPEAFEAKEGWGSQRKYVFKANAIDHSHARNVCSCKLWGEIVKSRANVPTELSSLVNGGAIDGFPIAVVLNDKFYALGTFNIPKDGWMFGNPKAILCADAHTDPTKFKALATLNGDFELEYVEDEDNADWVLTSINRAIQAVIDSDGTDIDTTIGQYIDIPSAIDYYIHTVNESADDGTSKNYILVTFDGVKWYFSAYDRDTTYGIRWDGTSFNRNPASGITFKTFADNHALMNLIFTHKKSELKARALQLNNQVTCEMNVYYVFANFIAGIPAELYAQNCKRWPLLRSTSVSNLDQILNWYRMRRAFLDKLIEEM